MPEELRPIIEEEPSFVLRTRHGSAVKVYRGLPQNEQALERVDAKFAGYPQLERRKRSVPHYNCHGLTFINRHGCVAVEAMELPRIWAPGWRPTKDPTDYSELLEGLLVSSGYHRVGKLGDFTSQTLGEDANLCRGDVVIYRDARGQISHSAIVWEVQPMSIKVLSKFGEAGEYFHDYRAIPDEFGYGRTVEFWTEREA